MYVFVYNYLISLHPYLNILVVRHVSSLYIEFSLNYQSLAFPSVISYSEPTDLGIPSLIKMRSASLISTRGSINQENEGKARNAELDLRQVNLFL